MSLSTFTNEELLRDCLYWQHYSAVRHRTAVACLAIHRGEAKRCQRLAAEGAAEARLLLDEILHRQRGLRDYPHTEAKIASLPSPSGA